MKGKLANGVGSQLCRGLEKNGMVGDGMGAAWQV